MRSDQTKIMVFINFAREYLVPFAVPVSFFPIYFWTYAYTFPREVRLLLDGGFYASIAFELVVACAACGFIARITAYQVTSDFSRHVFFSGRELRYSWAKPLQTVVDSIAPYLANEALVTISIFLITITFYFIGILGILFLLLYLFLLLSSFGSAEKTARVLSGDEGVVAIGNLKLAINTLSTISFQQIVSRHLKFLSLAILTLPFCLGGGRFVSLVSNDDVALTVNSNVVQSKLIASTDAGLLFMASSDAKILRLITWRPTDYFLIMSNGQVVCFGKRNTACKS